MNEFWAGVQEAGLTPETREALRKRYRMRGQKAIEAVESGRVKKYHDFFVVQGRSEEYIVEDDFCTCKDFTYRGRCCWHILAARIAALTGRYTPVNAWYLDIMGRNR
ncbi:putative nucleic acid-binding Zn finger protein [Methanofollis sp. W23]|uniref:SWIM zinc finger family protein n=1 Tax=Methanofollis sp. W23 TaxID=2817849 RepID=UPI001AE47E98|nr:SWIM zinc finger family protein [Methanofollis sp. W23]MBP2145584.1 putative nucleic acid-binding Zn finger protein [Methanofollis sp. W23]